ncbi:MAG: thermonuclease family protein [Rhodospirillales bacterium]|nr:thermonuclease family protein [Rhodospirillales bacterium]
MRLSKYPLVLRSAGKARLEGRGAALKGPFKTFLLALVLLASTPVAAGEDTATVASVVDGDTVVLTGPFDGATQIRLVGIQAPKLPLGRKNFPTWPLAANAKQALEKLTLGKTLGLSFGGARLDRHGRLLAHLQTPGGAWVQGEMLKLGMARVYSFADNRARVADMLALEAEARDAKRGIWGLRFYAVRGPDDLASWIGTFQLVEGRIVKAASIKGRVYLNFGENWRTDFTISIQPKARRLFAKSGIDPAAFEGQRVRVRGWLKKYNGPMIEATHPEQIEILAEK